MRRAAALLLPTSLIAPSAAFAHAGHGVTADPVLHLLMEPAHALPLLAAVALGVGVAFVRRAQKARTR